WNVQPFYASNIAGGATSLNITFGSALTGSGIVYALEYTGIVPSGPLDGVQFGAGTSSSMNSGALTTTNPGDILVLIGLSSNTVTGVAGGYTTRSTSWDNIVADGIGSSAGSYTATGTQNGNAWAMQLTALHTLQGQGPPARATNTPTPTN